MNNLNDESIIFSWHKNATPWVQAIKNNAIESRKLITNKSIITTIQSLSGETVIDIGCGEGWLTRELSAIGYKVTGIDVVPELIAAAKCQSNNEYYLLPYENIHNNHFTRKFDIAVCNFSLIGKQSVEHVFKTLTNILSSGGYFVIQTLHPNNEHQGDNTQDGWRQGSWQGFSSEFTDPAPWYFRTLPSWQLLFTRNHFIIERIIEPKNPQTGKLASLIIIGQLINHHK